MSSGKPKGNISRGDYVPHSNATPKKHLVTPSAPDLLGYQRNATDTIPVLQKIPQDIMPHVF